MFVIVFLFKPELIAISVELKLEFKKVFLYQSIVKSLFDNLASITC